VTSGPNPTHPLPLPFQAVRPLVGMIHLLPLPGSPSWGGSMPEVLERALMDGSALAAGGMDGIIVENFRDAPFFGSSVPPETVAALAVVTHALGLEVGIPVGVNVLRNDARSALGIAAATGAAFIRINVHTGSMFTDQGLLQGEAANTLRARSALGLQVPILADVFVKHASPPPRATLEGAARDTWHRGKADALILSGAGTGEPTDPTQMARVREAVPPAPVWLGSGLTLENAARVLDQADGAIVGSALQSGGVAGGGVEVDRVRALVDATR